MPLMNMKLIGLSMSGGITINLHDITGHYIIIMSA